MFGSSPAPEKLQKTIPSHVLFNSSEGDSAASEATSQSSGLTPDPQSRQEPRTAASSSEPLAVHILFGTSTSESRSPTCSTQSDIGAIPALPRNQILTERTGTWSLGAELHNIGQCTPCGWYWRYSGCSNDSQCAFCHMCPKGEVKLRKYITKSLGKEDDKKRRPATTVSADLQASRTPSAQAQRPCSKGAAGAGHSR